MGFNRSVDQCRIKVKKLHQQYIKVHDVLRKSGSSGEEKHCFPLYNDLDVILGTRPKTSLKHIVDSYEGETHQTASPAPTEEDDGSADRESDKSGKFVFVSVCVCFCVSS